MVIYRPKYSRDYQKTVGSVYCQDSLCVLFHMRKLYFSQQCKLRLLTVCCVYRGYIYERYESLCNTTKKQHVQRYMVYESSVRQQLLQPTATRRQRHHSFQPDRGGGRSQNLQTRFSNIVRS